MFLIGFRRFEISSDSSYLKLVELTELTTIFPATYIGVNVGDKKKKKKKN